MKLKLNTSISSAAQSPTEDIQTPLPASGIKLNFKRPGASSPPPPAPKPKRKYTKKDQPAASPANPKKRPRNANDEDETDRPISAKKQARTLPGPNTFRFFQASPATKRGPVIKLKTGASQPPTPITAARVKVKVRGKPPVRPLGVGYDSEASDAEVDPAIEENLILRMTPGPDCDYIRTAIENRKIGVPIREGGADVSMRFFTRDARRAVITVQGRHYAAVLVDLPCIVESMKSWDKRGWWKSADICQMLLVLGRVDNDEAAKTFPLPKELDEKTWQWPHGLTPPMHNVRKRRFRKRVSFRTIETAEQEVSRLLKADEDAEKQGGKTFYEILDLDRLRSQEEESAEEEEEYDENEDAEGEADEEANVYEEVEEEEDDEDHEAIAARLALEFETVDNGIVSTPAVLPSTNIARPDIVPPGGTTSAADGSADTGDSDDEGEEEKSSGEETQEDEVEDEPERERKQAVAQQREEIADIERELAVQKQRLNEFTNQLFRAKIMNTIKRLEGELQVKRLGLGDDDVDEDA